MEIFLRYRNTFLAIKQNLESRHPGKNITSAVLTLKRTGEHIVCPHINILCSPEMVEYRK